MGACTDKKLTNICITVEDLDKFIRVNRYIDKFTSFPANSLTVVKSVPMLLAGHVIEVM